MRAEIPLWSVWMLDCRREHEVQKVSLGQVKQHKMNRKKAYGGLTKGIKNNPIHFLLIIKCLFVKCYFEG